MTPVVDQHNEYGQALWHHSIVCRFFGDKQTSKSHETLQPGYKQTSKSRKTQAPHGVAKKGTRTMWSESGPGGQRPVKPMGNELVFAAVM